MLQSSTLRHLPPRLFPRLIPSTTTSIRNLSSSSSTASTTPKRRTLYDLAFIASAGIGVSGLLIWTNRRRTSTAASGTTSEMKEGDRTSFTVPVLNQQTGTPTTKTLSLLSQRETNLRLHSNEASYSVNRKRNPVFRYDTNVLESNNPVEDDSCCVILEREGGKQGVEGDLMFWGVFDGHSGWQTSRLLSSTLVSYVARELDLVFKGANPYLDLYHSLSSSSPLPDDTTPKFWSSFFSSSSSSSSALNARIELDTSTPILQAALKNSFLALDSEIVHGPITLLTQFEKKGGLLEGVNGRRVGEGGMQKEGTENLNKLLPALSGSCALLAFLDVGRNQLHVACTGDSRAVMGTWEPEVNGNGGGKWRVEVLSEDQTGKNLNEVKRMQSEHPASESDTVISRGRVLGGLEPSRAFGDARYKWPVGMQERLGAAFHPGSIRGRPRNYLTPPYVTAIPEVVSVDLSEGIAPSASGSGPTSNRFLVLATDGLYDRLSNEEIISLVGAHLTGTTGTQSRSSLLSHLSSPSSSSPSFTSPHVPREGGVEEYIFEDSNLSTHLIRNALGGARREQVSVLLSIPAPLSRRYRDDMTVTVILLGDSATKIGGEGGMGGVQRRDGQGQGSTEMELGGGGSQIKAKL